jgi:hypothetical protein
MARAGAEVWVNDLHRDRAEKVCAEIEAERLRARPVIADVTDRDAVQVMTAETGAVDILVNNAGIPVEGFSVKSFVDTGPDEWDPLIRLNLAAVLHVTRSYLPAMIERRWGRILTIVSDAGRRGERRQVVYGAAKAAGRRHRELHRPGHDEARPDRRGAGPGPADGGAAGAGLPRRSRRSTDRSRAARGAALQRRGGVDHRSGVPGRRRLRPGALSGH